MGGMTGFIATTLLMSAIHSPSSQLPSLSTRTTYRSDEPMKFVRMLFPSDSYQLQSRTPGLIHVHMNLYRDLTLQVETLDYTGRGLRNITVKLSTGTIVHLKPLYGLGGFIVPGRKTTHTLKKVIVDLTWSWQGEKAVNHGQAVFVLPKSRS